MTFTKRVELAPALSCDKPSSKTKYIQHGNVRYADGARVWESRDPPSRKVKYARDKFHINRQCCDQCTTAQHIASKSIVQQIKWIYATNANWSNFMHLNANQTLNIAAGSRLLKQLEILNFASLETLFNVTQEKYNDMNIMFVHRGPLSIKL